MTRTVAVPAPFEPLFEKAEEYVEKFFETRVADPTQGTIHVGGQRYVLMRGESVFGALYDSLAGAFGEEQSHELIYNMARVIGRTDCEAFSAERGITDPNERLSTGPVHFAYTGWAFVKIFDTSAPSPDENYFLHYEHPNTFESEVYRARKRRADRPICFFSAGYSAGWCSAAYGVEVHAREVKCTACGDDRCEFIMAPYAKLDEHAARLAAA